MDGRPLETLVADAHRALRVERRKRIVAPAGRPEPTTRLRFEVYPSAPSLSVGSHSTAAERSCVPLHRVLGIETGVPRPQRLHGLQERRGRTGARRT